MLAAALLIATATSIPPGDGLTLAPPPPPAVVAPGGNGPPALPLPDPDPPLWLGAFAVSMASLAQWARRRMDEPWLDAPDDIQVLFVPGHGSNETGTFAQMIDRLGLDGDDVIEFDYRLVEPWDSHVKASHKATVDELADGIASLLAGTGGERPVYLIGYSKGAAGIAELLARWDLHPALAPAFVVGAALLDPPISGGDLGFAQSLGRGPLAALPNDGGYTPRHCDAVVFDCHDTRAHLGHRAGIEVTVFRNPESALANFGDKPPGLRVYDVRDPDGGGLGIAAITAAHTFPLQSAAVAACIVDEMHAPRSCIWPLRRWQAGEW